MTNQSGTAVGVCPACGSNLFESVGDAASTFRGIENSAIPEHPSYVIHECQMCGLFYKSKVPTSESLAAYYAMLEFTPFDRDYGFPTDATLLIHLRHLPPGSRVLDFGCNTGRLLGALGPTYERFGVEINAAAAAKAQQRGIKIVAESQIKNVGPFDAVVVADVFEHLIEPTETLRKLANRLRPGGQLLIVTGLADVVRPRVLLGEHWYFRIFGHLQMLSRRHLDWLARTIGLALQSVDVMSHYKRLPGLRIKQLFQATLYETVKLAPSSPMAAVVRSVPGLKRANSWRYLPATDQSKDHVVVQLLKY